MRFDRIIVIGSNTVACKCIKELSEEIPADKIRAIESSLNKWSMLRSVCSKKKIDYCCVVKKDDIKQILDAEAEDNSLLIISANNRYIFRKDLISRDNVEIINFHYALLPDYRGSNIPSWVIYNDEKQTGVTWHYVTDKIDAGNILSQRVIEIGEQTTAYDIIKEGMRVSGECFSDFFPEILNKHVDGKKNRAEHTDKMYLSKDLPNGGVIDIDNDDIDIIDRVLRAYDHHDMNVMPPLRAVHDNVFYLVESYNIYSDEKKENGIEYNSDSIIVKNGYNRIIINFNPERGN